MRCILVLLLAYVLLFAQSTFGQGARAVDARSVKGRQLGGRTHSLSRTIYEEGPKEILYPSLTKEDKKRLAKESIDAARKIGIPFGDGKLMFPRTGMRLDDVKAVLGPPSGEKEQSNIDEDGNATFVTHSIWKSGKLSLLVTSSDKRVTNVIYPSLASEQVKKGIELREAISTAWNNIARESEEADRIASAKDKEASEKLRFESLFEESKVSRDWTLSSGKVQKGTIVGAEKDYILIEKDDSMDDAKPTRIEAIRLIRRDRDMVLAYCMNTKCHTPELNPTAKIKAGMSRSAVLSILGKPSEEEHTRAAFWDNVGDKEFAVYFEKGKVASVAFVEPMGSRLMLNSTTSR